jgi:hypothetical protein
MLFSSIEDLAKGRVAGSSRSPAPLKALVNGPFMSDRLPAHTAIELALVHIWFTSHSTSLGGVNITISKVLVLLEHDTRLA